MKISFSCWSAQLYCNFALRLLEMPKYIFYIFIVVGAAVAIYAKADQSQNQLILVAGIVVLMAGVYGVARTIPSKNDRPNDNENN